MADGICSILVTALVTALVPVYATPGIAHVGDSIAATVECHNMLLCFCCINTFIFLPGCQGMNDPCKLLMCCCGIPQAALVCAAV